MYDTIACTITCCRSLPKEPERTYCFLSVQTNWSYTDSGPAELKINYSTSKFYFQTVLKRSQLKILSYRRYGENVEYIYIYKIPLRSGESHRHGR